MSDKTIRAFFAVFSTVIYIIMLLLIFAIPAFLVYQSNREPVFTCRCMSCESAVGDEYIFSQTGTDGSGWYRLTYDCTASAGRFSPYEYKVGSFGVNQPVQLRKSADWLIPADTPVVFGRNGSSFTLTLYVRGNEEYARVLMNEAGFGVKRMSAGFSLIETDIMFNLPVFQVTG